MTMAMAAQIWSGGAYEISGAIERECDAALNASRDFAALPTAMWTALPLDRRLAAHRDVSEFVFDGARRGIGAGESALRAMAALGRARLARYDALEALARAGAPEADKRLAREALWEAQLGLALCDAMRAALRRLNGWDNLR